MDERDWGLWHLRIKRFRLADAEVQEAFGGGGVGFRLDICLSSDMTGTLNTLRNST